MSISLLKYNLLPGLPLHRVGIRGRAKPSKAHMLSSIREIPFKSVKSVIQKPILFAQECRKDWVKTVYGAAVAACYDLAEGGCR